MPVVPMGQGRHRNPVALDYVPPLRLGERMTTEQFTAPAAVVDALMAAHHALGTAQTGANGWDRAGLGRELDRIRWALGDLIAQVQPLTDAHTLNRETGVWELGDAHPFTNATERGDA